jgi:hypothetical protein
MLDQVTMQADEGDMDDPSVALFWQLTMTWRFRHSSFAASLFDLARAELNLAITKAFTLHAHNQ